MSSTTPTAASAGHRSRPRPPRTTATPSGPRNSSALAVPSGSRATAAMKNSVSPAVTTPSATQASRPERVKADGRGRTSEQEQDAGPGQTQPGRTLRADAVEQPDRGGEPELDAEHGADRQHGAERAVAATGAGEGRRGHPSSETTSEPSMST